MPNLPTPLAVVASDIHLSEKAPSGRKTDDWFADMAFALLQLRQAASTMNVDVVIAGDIFDKWNPSPELINFAADNLPKCYAVPGQHDLPNHNYNDIHRSGMGCLMRMGVVRLLEPDIPAKISFGDGCARLWGVPWGQEITALPKSSKYLDIAVVHAYCWAKGHEYTGAPLEKNYVSYGNQLAGYAAALFGDNHKGFLTKSPHGTNILNCGGFMRRTTDEKDYQPCYGVLYTDGSIVRVPLETRDVWHDEAVGAQLTLNDAPMDKATEYLRSLITAGGMQCLVDYRKVVHHYLESEKPNTRVRDLVINAIGG